MVIASDMTIGGLAFSARCTVPTIRYYEAIGLLPEANRGASGHRVYGDADLHRLTFIRRCRDFGFRIEQIRELVALMRSSSENCAAARDLAQEHLGEVRTKLKELRTLERSLKKVVADCTAQCFGGPAGDCVILEDLAGSNQQSCCGSGGQARKLPRACDDDCGSSKT